MPSEHGALLSFGLQASFANAPCKRNYYFFFFFPTSKKKAPEIGKAWKEGWYKRMSFILNSSQLNRGKTTPPWVWAAEPVTAMYRKRLSWLAVPARVGKKRKDKLEETATIISKKQQSLSLPLGCPSYKFSKIKPEHRAVTLFCISVCFGWNLFRARRRKPLRRNSPSCCELLWHISGPRC